MNDYNDNNGDGGVAQINTRVVRGRDAIAQQFGDNYYELCGRGGLVGGVHTRKNFELGARVYDRLSQDGRFVLVVATIGQYDAAVVAMFFVGVMNSRTVPLIGGLTLQQQHSVVGVRPVNNAAADAVRNFAQYDGAVGTVFSFCAKFRAALVGNRAITYLLAYAAYLLTNEFGGGGGGGGATAMLVQTTAKNEARFTAAVQNNDGFQNLVPSFLVDGNGNIVVPSRVLVAYQQPFVDFDVVGFQPPEPAPAPAPEPAQELDIGDGGGGGGGAGAGGEEYMDGGDGGEAYDGGDGGEDYNGGDGGQNQDDVVTPPAQRQRVENAPPVAQAAPPAQAAYMAGPKTPCFPDGHLRRDGTLISRDGVVPNAAIGETCCGYTPALGNFRGKMRQHLLQARVYSCLKTGTGVGLYKQGVVAANANAADLEALRQENEVLRQQLQNN